MNAFVGSWVRITAMENTTNAPGRGDTARDVQVLDSTGALQTISSLVADSPRVFVFYRGYW